MNTGTQNSISTIASTGAMRHACAVLRKRPAQRLIIWVAVFLKNELAVAKRSFQLMTARLHQCLVQGKSTTRLLSFVKNCLRWAKPFTFFKAHFTLTVQDKSCSVEITCAAIDVRMFNNNRVLNFYN